MMFVAIVRHRFGRATPSLRDALQRQSREIAGRETIYRDRNAVQTNPATSEVPRVLNNCISVVCRKIGLSVLDDFQMGTVRDKEQTTIWDENSNLAVISASLAGRRVGDNRVADKKLVLR
jgi:hypothetical protein